MNITVEVARMARQENEEQRMWAFQYHKFIMDSVAETVKFQHPSFVTTFLSPFLVPFIIKFVTSRGGNN